MLEVFALGSLRPTAFLIGRVSAGWRVDAEVEYRDGQILVKRARLEQSRFGGRHGTPEITGDPGAFEARGQRYGPPRKTGNGTSGS